jgi:hypothetical protein
MTVTELLAQYEREDAERVEPSWRAYFILDAVALEAQARSYELNALSALVDPQPSNKSRAERAAYYRDLANSYRGMAARQREQAKDCPEFRRGTATITGPAPGLVVVEEIGGIPVTADTGEPVAPAGGEDAHAL